MNTTFDVIVVGGGPVGWACALAAISATSAALRPRVCVIDRGGVPVAPTGDIESRIYTVSADNLGWLDSLGVALDKTRSAVVEKIHVFDQQHKLAINVSAGEARKPTLASIVEHNALAAQLHRRCEALGVQFIAAEVKHTGQLDNLRYVELGDGQIFNANLVVLAQGGDRALLNELGISALERNYDRVGVVANFSIAKAHAQTARQWFLPDQSILALLPLPHQRGEPSVSMVWSTRVDAGNDLMESTREALCEAVAEATQHLIRPHALLNTPKRFPLTLSRVANPVAARSLVVGDAAHAIHPLAGQGVNLGLQDARALAAALSHAESVNGDYGHALLLGKYRRIRYAATLAMQTATDALARIYNGAFAEKPSPIAISATVGDAGMRVLGRLPAFRRMLSSAAS